tara:strand:- start:8572 stop:8742 length:171 start_codon:yes stop_codon:yes gene_type:complete
MMDDLCPPEEGVDFWKREVVNWMMDLAKQQTEILNALNELRDEVRREGKGRNDEGE